ncbi:hypothetical protein MNBD_BACTEROID06-156 [hydrothermal vent metagenome]|uniref:Uncharacterized protein n=1 Tax=hydrothermal vent metagenome TaxID=652676 RepID=A0A3B0UD45_9ZZZZ
MDERARFLELVYNVFSLYIVVLFSDIFLNKYLNALTAVGSFRQLAMIIMDVSLKLLF